VPGNKIVQGPTARKLPKAQRRDQLLDTALEIVREEGTDALTLGYLAERAGVSKPVAYDHFGTRAGLLIALYKQLDDLQVAALREAVEQAPRRLADVARVVSKAYMDCTLSAGAEWHTVSAALQGDEEMEAFQRELIDGYVALYCEAFATCTDLPPDELRLRCIGILGAAEAISREVIRGKAAEKRAVATLAGMMIAWLSAAP
jgi:AcrR family transcriptional regulator